MEKKKSNTPMCDEILEKLSKFDNRSTLEKDLRPYKLPFYYLGKIRAEAALQTAKDTARIADSLEKIVLLIERSSRRHD